jgi:hypothetical protein
MLTGVGPAAAQQAQAKPQQFALTDTKGLVGYRATLEPGEWKGRKAVKLTVPKDAREIALGVLDGVDFQDGVIEVDLAAHVTTPPGVRMPGFIGVAFRVGSDTTHYELFYVRPKNSRTDDQAMRNHAVQYGAPDYPWWKLRRNWPWVYEAWADLEPEGWNHLKIEVAGRTAKLFVNNSAQPALVIDGLKGEDLHGAIALHGNSGEESYFSNLRITPTTPLPVKNGSDATGDWQVKLDTDIGKFDGTLQLHRDGKAITGTWSSEFAKDRPVTGTWRDGYVELSFDVEWSKDKFPNIAGTVTTSMAGWIDDASAKGRVKIDGRTDGVWTATRTQATK